MPGGNATKIIGAIALAVVAAFVIGQVVDFGTDAPVDRGAQQAAVVANDPAPAAPAASPAPAAPPAVAEPPAPADAPAVAAAPPAADAASAVAGDAMVLLAAADADAGLKLARRRCFACHTFDAGGANRVGPNLYDVVGRAKGTSPNFVYSESLLAAGGDWTYADLDAFLTKPTDFLGDGTKMNKFPGVPVPEDRAAIIAFLRGQSDAPLPLPAE